jgi:hypothetical protein
MYTEVVKNPRWQKTNGSVVVSKGDGLLDVIMMDSNPFMPHYLNKPKDMLPYLPGGLLEQNPNKTLAMVQQQLRDSNATWRIFVSHHVRCSAWRRGEGGVRSGCQVCLRGLVRPP